MHGPKHFIFLFLPLDTHEQSHMKWELTHEETVTEMLCPCSLQKP